MHNGAWDKGAWFLTGLPDPVSPKAFAGTAAEMSAAASYLKAMQELSSRVGRQGEDLETGASASKLTKAQKKALAEERKKNKEEGDG